ncbi:flagellar motor protein MotB [Halopseudomonas salegens]|uniref:Chemotaxis protein MotB n=1 Tax=Halopseudomonas salegens TaxID=1434072 RepID=A0A1H2E9D2_9GAMM|nr:flagellar motor protein MotB [Halopseudomonas salegens]SDT91644.1 chemotaxis protein MotB [Halopseudomonas salegens]
MDNTQPIIVKRISRKADGHHGGSWKIAFADFAVAMMAFFLVMWLLTTADETQLQMISGYFNDPINFDTSGSPFVIDLGGTPEMGPEQSIRDQEATSLDAETIESLAEQLERMELDLLLQELQNRIDTEPVLQRFREQILLEITADGLRIQIVDAENRPMFTSGSARLQDYFEEILLALSDTIAKVENKISISGHTDAQPFTVRRDYGNWELSADRANAARRTLLAAGYPQEQIARVVGYADSAPFDADNPLNPINRRIEIVVLNKRAERMMVDSTRGDMQPVPEEQTQDQPDEPTAEPESVPAAPEPEPPANLFEDAGSLERLRE